MTAVFNETLAKAFIKGLEEKLIIAVQSIPKKLTNEDLLAMICETFPSEPRDGIAIKEAKMIIAQNQNDILHQNDQINYLKRKQQIENELTVSFIKAIIKDKSQNRQEPQIITAIKRDSVMIGSEFSRVEGSKLELSKQSDNYYEKSPILGISQKEDLEEEIITDKKRPSISRASTYQSSSEFTIQAENEEREKVKALSKLRKLEKYVFEKENIRKDRSQTKLWNCGVSPSKKRYQEENDNLKAIQTNLVTHLSMLEKYREVPSIEGLLAKEEVLKKKERNLKELNENLEKREFEINRKHSEFLKRQKSLKVL